MAALTVSKVVDAGTKPSFVAASTSDTAPIGTGLNTFMVYKNTDSTNLRTLTFVVPGTTATGDTPTQHVVSLPAVSGEVWVPLRKAYDDGTGNVTVNMTGTGAPANVTVAVVQVG